jgi:Cu(I)/Ag(I) efflux system membrane fusion protein
MLVYVYLQTGGGRANVVIPKSAVIYGANREYVWIQGLDSNFEMREVRLGSNNRTMITVLQGVQPGDRVVSQGAYLVNSEYILKYGTGVNMAGMQMSDMKMSGRSN